jgi:hypothetical protein
MRKIYAKATNNMYGFTKTNEKIEVTFNGWDGKSYDGEARKMNVWASDKYPDEKFVYIRKSFDGTKADCFHIVTDNMIIEKATGIAHPEVDYFTSYEVDYTTVE